MGLAAVPPPPALGALLRMSRRNLGLTLRQVSDHCHDKGERIPVSTLARIESGKLDPGIRRLHMLFRLYRVPGHLVEDLVELDRLATDPPSGESLDTLYRKGVESWKKGQIGEGLAYLMAVRQTVSDDDESRPLRQSATLAFAIAARNLGKFRLAKSIVDELLLEPVDDSLMTRVLVLASSLWRGLGSPEIALALINRAAQRVGDAADQDSAFVFHQEAKLLVELGEPKRAAASLDRAIALYRQSGDTYDEARARVLRVSVLEKGGQPAKAVEAARQAIRFAVRHKYRRVEVFGRIELGRLQVAGRTRAKGIEGLRKALSDAVLLDDKNAEFLAHYHLWKAYEKQGSDERARFEFEAAANYIHLLDEASAEVDEVRERIRSRGTS